MHQNAFLRINVSPPPVALILRVATRHSGYPYFYHLPQLCQHTHTPTRGVIWISRFPLIFKARNSEPSLIPALKTMHVLRGEAMKPPLCWPDKRKNERVAEFVLIQRHEKKETMRSTFSCTSKYACKYNRSHVWKRERVHVAHPLCTPFVYQTLDSAFNSLPLSGSPRPLPLYQP